MNRFFRIDAAEQDDPLSNFEPVSYSTELQRALAEDHVGALNSRPYLMIAPQAPLSEAIEMLHQSGVSSLLVVDGQRLVGIFTERDVLEKVVEQYSRVSSDPVERFMTSDPTIVFQTDPSAAAAAAIAVAGHRHVPVVDMDQHVQGIVSPRRVFEFMEQHF